MYDLTKIVPFIVAMGLIVLILPSHVTAEEPQQGPMEKKLEETSDGGYHIRIGEMNVYYYGHRMKFNTADTEDFDDFHLNMRALKVEGDLDGAGSGEYYCNLDQVAWQYHTGEGYGLIEGYADLDLEMTSSHGQNTDPSSSSGNTDQNQNPTNSEDQGGSKPDETGGQQDDGGPGSEDEILKDWARLMIRFQGLDNEGGLKFDIRIQLKEEARGDTKIKLEQDMKGEKNTYEHRHITRTGESAISGKNPGEYQLRSDDRMVAKYSWLYQYNTTNENGTQIEQRSLNEDILEGENIAFEYQIKEGERNVIHDPNIFVNSENIISIMDEAGDLVEEHWGSILAGVLLGVILIILVSATFMKLSANGSNDDEKFDLRKNRYYK